MCACARTCVRVSFLFLQDFQESVIPLFKLGLELRSSGGAAGTCTCWATWTTYNLSVSSTVQSYLPLKVKTIHQFSLLIMFESQSLITSIHYYISTRSASASPFLLSLGRPVYRLEFWTHTGVHKTYSRFFESKKSRNTLKSFINTHAILIPHKWVLRR